MTYQVFRSWFLLVYVDLLMHFGGFTIIHEKIREERVRHNAAPNPGSEVLCRAVDLACVFYFKKVLCLQRSAATAILLRRSGWEAQLVIGAQLFPLKSHAWVESDGKILNDKPYMLEIYQVLERC
jgi:hypothetical protein